MTERSDTDLVRLIQNGDSAAGGELFQKYGPRIFYLALRDLRSRTDAEDVRAETFLRVLTAIRLGISSWKRCVRRSAQPDAKSPILADRSRIRCSTRR